MISCFSFGHPGVKHNSNFVTATLDGIHDDPSIINQAIIMREPLKIITGGQVVATLTPAPERPVLTASRFNAAAHRAWLDRTWGKCETESVSVSPPITSCSSARLESGG